MRIAFLSIPVDDQTRALEFYTHVLGFHLDDDQQIGTTRRLTLSAPEDADGARLALELTAFPAARRYQKALYGAGIPVASLLTDHLDADLRALNHHGIQLRGRPVRSGDIRYVTFDDTCGNLVRLIQEL